MEVLLLVVRVVQVVVVVVATKTRNILLQIGISAQPLPTTTTNKRISGQQSTLLHHDKKGMGIEYQSDDTATKLITIQKINGMLCKKKKR